LEFHLLFHLSSLAFRDLTAIVATPHVGKNMSCRLFIKDG
jgi:hypothetical protein